MSRLANYFPERASAYAFLALSYWDPIPDVSFQEFLDINEKAAGYQIFGYWPFFSEDDANTIIQAHVRFFPASRLNFTNENLRADSSTVTSTSHSLPTPRCLVTASPLWVL